MASVSPTAERTLREKLRGCRSTSPVEREDPLDGLLEDPRQLEAELEARIVPFGLDRVDRLTRNMRAAGEVGLRPVPFGAQHLHTILHAIRAAARATLASDVLTGARLDTFKGTRFDVSMLYIKECMLDITARAECRATG